MQIGMRRAAYNVKNANFVNATIVSFFLFFFLGKLIQSSRWKHGYLPL